MWEHVYFHIGNVLETVLSNWKFCHSSWQCMLSEILTDLLSKLTLLLQAGFPILIRHVLRVVSNLKLLNYCGVNLWQPYALVLLF